MREDSTLRGEPWTDEELLIEADSWTAPGFDAEPWIEEDPWIDSDQWTDIELSESVSVKCLGLSGIGAH